MENIGSIVAILIAISGFIFQQFGVISGIKERLSSLETKMDLFWKGIENKVVEMLKSYPTFLEKDVLLDKMTRKELNQEEAERLRTILTGEMDKNNNDDARKIAYVLVIGRLEQIILDIKDKTKC